VPGKDDAVPSASDWERRGIKVLPRVRDAAIRFVLGNPNVATACCQTQTYGDLKAVVGLSGTRLTQAEEGKLAACREGCGGLYCRHACGRDNARRENRKSSGYPNSNTGFLKTDTSYPAAY